VSPLLAFVNNVEQSELNNLQLPFTATAAPDLGPAYACFVFSVIDLTVLPPYAINPTFELKFVYTGLTGKIMVFKWNCIKKVSQHSEDKDPMYNFYIISNKNKALFLS
jgi:hypothetical protein